MENQNNNPNKRQIKDTEFKAQLLRVQSAFKEKPMTMLEADIYTGVMRSNICRHLDKLEIQGEITLIRKRKCSISGWEAGEYTADQNLFPKSNQLKLL